MHSDFVLKKCQMLGKNVGLYFNVFNLQNVLFIPHVNNRLLLFYSTVAVNFDVIYFESAVLICLYAVP